MDTRQLRLRWQEDDGPALAYEVLSRLQAGRSLDGLGLGMVDGRIDVRGIAVPKPTESSPRTYTIRISDGSEFSQTWVSLDGVIKFDGLSLSDLDFSGGNVSHFRLVKTRLTNCVFDKAECQDWRLWGSEIRDSRFVDADLSDLSVGAAHQGIPNRISRVDFTRADLSGSRTRNWGIAQVTDCDFSFAHLEDINFFQAELVRCKFAGTLRNIIFDGRVLRPADKAIPNPMEDIDMSGVAEFQGVDFRGVNFDRITLPDDPNLIVMRDPRWVDFMLDRLQDRGDLVAGLAAIHPEQARRFDKGAHSFVNLGNAANENEALANELLRQLLREFQRTVANE